MNKMYNEVAGFIPEEELDQLVKDSNGGGTPTITTSSVLCVGIIAATYLAGFCPTSACTKSCNK